MFQGPKDNILVKVAIHRTLYLSILSLAFAGILRSEEKQTGKPVLEGDPIVFDESRNLLVASNARLRNGPMLLLADKIELDRNASLATATGKVILTAGAFRALADSMILNLESGDVTATNFRMGLDPVIAEGSNAERKDGVIRLEEANLYFREKRPWEPSLGAKSMEVDPEDGTFEGRGVGLRLGNFTIAKLPKLKLKTRDPIFEGRVSVGKDDNLGWHLDLGSLYRLSEGIQAGGSVTGFTKRGVMLSPESIYERHYEGGYVKGNILSGFINDNGDNRGLDIEGQPVEADRGYADLSHVQRIKENFRVALQGEWRSDSETFRDFRRNQFYKRQWNDSHAEVGYEGSNFSITAFARLHANDFETVVERRPELSLDLAPVTLLIPELYHSASLSVASLRKAEADSSPTPDLETDRLDFTYGLKRPIRLAHWLNLTPLATYRLVDYDYGQGNPSRHLAEFGADLRVSMHGDFDAQNETWEIDGIRHDVGIVLSHRRLKDVDSDDPSTVPAIDSTFFPDPNLGPLDLFDMRQTDSIRERHLFRIGLENRVLTRGQDGLPRSLGALLLYQDLLPERNDGEHAFDDLFGDLLLSPADWLSLGMQSKLDIHTGQVARTALTTRLKDGDVTELGFSLFDYEDFSRQYQLTGTRKISERQSVFGGLRYDSEGKRFTHLFLGARRRIGDSWDLLYSVTRRKGAIKEDDWEFDASIRLYSF